MGGKLSVEEYYNFIGANVNVSNENLVQRAIDKATIKLFGGDLRLACDYALRVIEFTPSNKFSQQTLNSSTKAGLMKADYVIVNWGDINSWCDRVEKSLRTTRSIYEDFLEMRENLKRKGKLDGHYVEYIEQIGVPKISIMDYEGVRYANNMKDSIKLLRDAKKYVKSFHITVQHTKDLTKMDIPHDVMERKKKACNEYEKMYIDCLDFCKKHVKVDYLSGRK